MSASNIHFEDTDRIQEFTAASTAWTVPNGVSVVTVSGCGGGQGGSEKSTSGGNNIGMGGNGAPYGSYTVPVVPGESVTIIVGAGGSPDSQEPTSSSNGSQSSFTPATTTSSTLIFKGATGLAVDGSNDSVNYKFKDAGRAIPGCTMGGAVSFSIVELGFAGGSGIHYSGGAAGATSVPNGGGSGGGAGPFGNGGAGGAHSGNNGVSAGANTGAGGGGSTGGNTAGSGGSGKIIVSW